MLLRLSRPSRSHRPRLTLLAAGVLLSGTVLAGCGFEYQTDRINIISAGINDRTGEVDVLGAVVIAGQDDLGLFVATFANKNYDDSVALTGLEQTDDLEAAQPSEPVELTPGGRANLFDTGGIEVTGTFTAGDFVAVTATFDSGQVTSLDVPVVTPCRQYSPDVLPGITLPTPSEGTTETPIDPGDGTAAEDDEATEPDGEPGRYSCEQAEPVEHGAGDGEAEQGGAEEGQE